MNRPAWILIGLLVVAGASILVVSGGQADPPGRSSPAQPITIDCGNSRARAKQALRSFTAVLRRGDEQQVLSLLAGRKRFFALGASFQNGNTAVSSSNPRDAAKQVADYGGLPIRIDDFMNAEGPRRVTDFGFFATWNGRRPATGKAAIDCKAGKVIVFNVGVGGRDR